MKLLIKIAIASSIVTSTFFTYMVCISIGLGYFEAIPYTIVATAIIQAIILVAYLTITLDPTPPKL